MTSSKENKQSLGEFFAADPAEADRRVFGRVSYPDRRGFFKGAGLATMGTLLGMSIPFHRNMPQGLIPAALAKLARELFSPSRSTRVASRTASGPTPDAGKEANPK